MPSIMCLCSCENCGVVVDYNYIFWTDVWSDEQQRYIKLKQCPVCKAEFERKD